MSVTRHQKRYEDDEEDDGEISEDDEIDFEMIKSKFSTLAAALEETNKNLVTFELLQDHYRNVTAAMSAPEASSQPEKSQGPDHDVDIVDLLRDICGSVNELKNEMGNSNPTGKFTLAELEEKMKYPQKFAELSERSTKIEVECEFYKNQYITLEEKYMEEKRKNIHLSDLIRSREDEILKLNLYLKEAEDFSKKLEQENKFIHKQISDVEVKLKDEISEKQQIQIELHKYIKHEEPKDKSNDGDVEPINVQSISAKETDTRRKVEEIGSDVDMDLGVLDQVYSARSTVSSKSVEGGYEQKYKELRESRNRLKQKTKLLLRQYRGKRNQLEKKERQISAQRFGLMKLQTLHQSVEANHFIVIHHLGQQIQQTANLVNTIWPGDDLSCLEGADPEEKLSDWIIMIDSLSAWTIGKLVKVSMGRRDKKIKENRKLSGEEIKSDRKSICAAARKCELGIVDEEKTVASLISGLVDDDEGGDDTDKQVGTWM